MSTIPYQVMSDTPRTDVIVRNAERHQESFLDAYLNIRELAKELERENNQLRSANSSKRSNSKASSIQKAKKTPEKSVRSSN